MFARARSAVVLKTRGGRLKKLMLILAGSFVTYRNSFAKNATPFASKKVYSKTVTTKNLGL
jgi:hypothetical protein